MFQWNQQNRWRISLRNAIFLWRFNLSAPPETMYNLKERLFVWREMLD